MKKIFYIILLVSMVTTACQPDKDPEDIFISNVPSISEVSGVWVSADTADMEPSLRNFRGQALLNRDMTSVSWLASAPYSGGYHTGVLKINGKIPMADMFRWLPHQAIRKGEMDMLKIFSTVKMIPEQNGLMWEISISNEDSVARDLDLSLDMIGFISKYEGDWQWWYPYPKIDGKTTKRDEEVENVRRYIGSSKTSSATKNIELVDGKPTQTDKTAHWPSDEEILQAKKYSASLHDQFLLVSDTESDAKTGFSLLNKPDEMETKSSGGRAKWNKKLQPGESFILSYVMAFDDDEDKVMENLNSWTTHYDSVFRSVDEFWNDKWHELFMPDNDLISGCFPVLETEDEKAKKVYYTGPLTLLYLIHNHLPEHKKAFLTGGPRWGASITFFWDITEWSTLWAVVDPEMMKEHLSSWIKIDPSKYYGQDNFGGKGVGNGYSANYWALFQMIRSYVTITKDFQFLDSTINGMKVIEHLDNYALNWKNLSPYGKEGFMDEAYKLADFGDDEWNLLECVPTYKHIVPSFNAGYIWMMRELAALYEAAGNTTRSHELTKEADKMIDRLLTLYAGNGVWNSLYPNGKTIEVRHCLDFMFIGRYIPEDIPENIRNEMLNFLYRELMTNNWMRAQSLKDVAAENSDRPDHGPLGAFDGWPAGTMDALTQMGYPDKALEFYHNIEPVTYEGCWAQAHELWGEHKYEKNARVRIAQRGWHNRESSGGISLSQVVLKDFFGFYPEVERKILRENIPSDFSGKLYHVLYAGDYYTLIAGEGKVKMKKE